MAVIVWSKAVKTRSSAYFPESESSRPWKELFTRAFPAASTGIYAVYEEVVSLLG